jgi:hypothetical protein
MCRDKNRPAIYTQSIPLSPPQPYLYQGRSGSTLNLLEQPALGLCFYSALRSLTDLGLNLPFTIYHVTWDKNT